MSIAEATTARVTLPTEECIECGSPEVDVNTLYGMGRERGTGYSHENAFQVTCTVCPHTSIWDESDLNAIAEAA